MKINVAAVQMRADLADVASNLRKVENLSRDAAKRGASIVILPEFFTSACAFHPNMTNAILPIDGKAKQLLVKLSQELNIVIGGSFIASHDQEVFNTFLLVFPGGEIYMHNKDIPTMWENCYYTGGNDDGVLETELGSIGVALCWEMLRTQTAKRLFNKVKLLVGGSCWWDLPNDAPSQFDNLRKVSLEMLKAAPVHFAKILGVPVIHAGHAGKFEGYAAPSNEKLYRSRYLGESMIVDGEGNILANLSLEDGEAVIIAEIDIGQSSAPSMQIPESYWIPEMPKAFLSEWEKQNKFGKEYYNNRLLRPNNK